LTDSKTSAAVSWPRVLSWRHAAFNKQWSAPPRTAPEGTGEYCFIHRARLVLVLCDSAVMKSLVRMRDCLSDGSVRSRLVGYVPACSRLGMHIWQRARKPRMERNAKRASVPQWPATSPACLLAMPHWMLTSRVLHSFTRQG